MKIRRGRKLALMRRATTEAQQRFTISGREKTQRKRRPITLPYLKCLEPKP